MPRLLISQSALVLTFLISWQLASFFRLIDPFLFSAPSTIIITFVTTIMDGTFPSHVVQTCIEVMLSFLIGTIGGTLLAATLWAFPFFARVVQPFLIIAHSLPKIALAPILIVFIGPTTTAIVAMGVLVTIMITTVVTWQAYETTPAGYLRIAATFEATKWQQFRSVVFPANRATLLSVCKVNVGLAWIGTIVGEFLVAKAGLGYVILASFQTLQLTNVYVSLCWIAFFATVMYYFVTCFERQKSQSG